MFGCLLCKGFKLPYHNCMVYCDLLSKPPTNLKYIFHLTFEIEIIFNTRLYDHTKQWQSNMHDVYLDLGHICLDSCIHWFN